MFELIGLVSTALCCLLLLSIAICQGFHLKRSALRLPEASGERLQARGSDFSIVHVGESPVAGVGVAEIRQGLTHQVIRNLTQDRGVEFDWEILAKNGARVFDSLTFEATIKEPDLLIISFGVNDTTRFTSGSEFNKHMQACVHRFASDNTRVFITSIPKINRFPLIPAPLSWLLGAKAYLLDRQLQKLCQQEGWTYIHSDTNPDASLMAEDGYHPNESGCQVWGGIIADRIIDTRSDRV
ncbi:SGNH/GDSL hydrolase family protein [Endozoicomonas acroporae]|uniref:SGNH/GDSL hydrolase family protein n=1 Tax=Endozoicomonas acroporae TaxID=1701104 RepID=UPI0013D29A07|nr:SGNH/GDSL hydrolase family protein [Endozoicomonas acroporae]